MTTIQCARAGCDRPATKYVNLLNMPMCDQCRYTWLSGYVEGRRDSEGQLETYPLDAWCALCAHPLDECVCEEIYGPEELEDLRGTRYGE